MSKTTKKKQKAIHVSNKMLAQIPNEGDPKPFTPKNCNNPCPYGAGRPFCFPCYAKILKEHREMKKQ